MNRYISMILEVDGSLHSPPEQCLELIQTISTIPTGYPNSLNTCGRITVHNTGRFVLVSNRGHNSICVLSVEKYSGLLQVKSPMIISEIYILQFNHPVDIKLSFEILKS